MFGYWDWRGGHDTPSAADEIDVFSRLGFESTSRGAVNPEGDPAGALAMKKSPIRSYICKGNGEARGYGRDKEKSLSDLKADWERYVARPARRVAGRRLSSAAAIHCLWTRLPAISLAQRTRFACRSATAPM